MMDSVIENEFKVTICAKEAKVTSIDSSERILARTLRIAKRQEIFKRQETISEENRIDIYENDEAISIVEKQAAECAALLEHLLADGEERVTNVRVASDAREVARRFKEAKKRQELLTKLEDEANLAQTKFSEITSQWNVILKLNDPLDIEDEINSQKQKCNDLILQKNELIRELKNELKRADETFYKDLKKQLNDIKVLGERIDAQVVLMKNAYQSQLNLIEQSIEMEQAVTIKNNKERWSSLYIQRDVSESENTKKKIVQISQFSNKMDVLSSEHREKYRLTKMKLEADIQTLQNEFQELKANCLINSEKIDYNYQILKRREEENILIRTHQKRRLNKMQSVINELKMKIKEINKNGIVEEAKANKEIQRLECSILELQTKANHFALINDKKYQQIWKMNEEKSNDVIKKINNLDKIVHEQILEFDWVLPKFDILKKSDLMSYKSGQVDTLDHFLNAERSASDSSLNIHDEHIGLIQRILNMIADSSGFLIEERLWPLLDKYETLPTTLCKIDNIFNALSITDDKDVNILFKYFMKYACCIKCKFEQRDASYTKPDVDSKQFDDDKGLMKTCECGNSLTIIPSNALSAIRDFVADVKITEEPTPQSPTNVNALLSSRSLTEKDVSLFWKKYRMAFTPQKEKLWDTIILGFNKYLPVLQDRHRLHKEVLHLRKQNLELKNLLRGHNTIDTYKQKYLTPLQKEFKIPY